MGSSRPGGALLHVDCTAFGLSDAPATPVFQPGRIVLQQVRHLSPCFNAALIGFVEAQSRGGRGQEPSVSAEPIPAQRRGLAPNDRHHLESRGALAARARPVGVDRRQPPEPARAHSRTTPGSSRCRGPSSGISPTSAQRRHNSRLSICRASPNDTAQSHEGGVHMPLINVKLIEDVFTPEQKGEIVEKLTDAMVSIEGENMRGVTWVVIEEVRERRLGYRRQRPEDRGRQGDGRRRLTDCPYLRVPCVWAALDSGSCGGHDRGASSRPRRRRLTPALSARAFREPRGAPRQVVRLRPR